MTRDNLAIWLAGERDGEVAVDTGYEVSGHEMTTLLV